LFEGDRLSRRKVDHQPFPDQREGGIMLHDRNGQSVVEYIVVLAIFIALVGGALWEVFSTLKVKFNDVNAEIGS
jgi:Flp pilus assembly pilin Flp